MTAVQVASAKASVSLRFSGSLAALSAADRIALLDRGGSAGPDATASAARIIADVRARGDAALLRMARDFDGVELESLEVPRLALTRALDVLAPAVRRSLERAARNIESVHRAFMPTPMQVETEPGVVVGRRPDPLSRVGIYAPGGRAAYPSSVLMAAVPARVAGVGEIVLATPPDASGLPARITLAAAALAGVDRVFAVGGAGAVAALAYGTESIPRVDRIVGPGNAWVAAAKLLVNGVVGIDSPAGPSELLVIADETCDAAGVAAELQAQAEHDPAACVVALALDAAIAAAIEREIQSQADTAVRRGVVVRALASRGAVLSVDTMQSALAFAAEFAPEHLLLAVAAPETILQFVRNAGTVFVGATSSVVFGDYLTGANHVLPTGGSARSFSGLSPLDFVRWTSWQQVSAAAAQSLASDAVTLAECEGLYAHADAVRPWSESP